ncbi:MAG: methionyl-tRNA formyltransferase [Runella sp.]
MMSKLRIVFMGTPDFAVGSLQKLIENDCEVVAVVTAPDKPAGRGLQLVPSPVKQYALTQGIPVLQPEKLKNPAFLEELRSYRADVQVVVAFRMLPEVVWNMPPKGTFNLHASLLPQYRGAAPIHWAVINGETETGVSTFFLNHEIDTGPLIFQEKEPISPTDDVGALYHRLMHKGAELVLRTIRAIEADDYPQIPQPTVENLRLAPKIFKETCQINWQQPSQKIYNFVRGLSPFPAAWTLLEGKMCKIYRTSLVEESKSQNLKWSIENKTFRTDGKTLLHFRTLDDWIAIEELQIEGKKRMTTVEFLRGYRF